MSKNRQKSGLIHIKDGIALEVSKAVKTGKYFIKNTFEEVQRNQLKPKNHIGKKVFRKSNYNFSKPHQAQNLGDEWDHYAWGADDY